MFKKIVSIVIVSLMFLTLLSGCGDPKTIRTPIEWKGNENGTYVSKTLPVTYGTYGLINAKDEKNPNIQYRLIIGNIVWSVLLSETLIAPFYFIGFDLYEPIGLKDPNYVKGQIN